jgi:hypothetical protein
MRQTGLMTRPAKLSQTRLEIPVAEEERQIGDKHFGPLSVALDCGVANGRLDILTGSSASTPSTFDLTTPNQETSFTDEVNRNSHLIQVP